MKVLKEVILTRDWFYYRRYEQDMRLRHKRISPQSYRAGIEIGYMSGFATALVLCLLVASAIVGSGVLELVR